MNKLLPGLINCKKSFLLVLIGWNTLIPSDGETQTIVGWGDLMVPEEVTNVIAIATGFNHSLMLKQDGSVTGWGTYYLVHPYYTNIPVTVPKGLTNVIAISGGDSHSMALKADGTIVAWGYNPFGQLDIPRGLSNVVAIAAGSQHSLALKSDGTVVSCGTWGTDDLKVPDGLTDVVAIGAGRGSVALKADGSLAVWGRWESTNVPPELTNVVAVAGSYFGWLALRANGTVFDSFGEGVTALSGHTNIVAIAGSYGSDGHQNLALEENGTVVGWGFDYFTGPVPSGLSNVVAIAAGGYHNLALIASTPPLLRVLAAHPTLSESGFGVSVPTRSGKVYRLEYRTSVGDTKWKPLPLVAGTGSVLRLTDPEFDGSSRFYRVRQW